ncbi:hypothetical protein [Mycobacterium sp. D16Q16]|uniref:hypothetical protein n=1 Tax=Mycobacterium sp. D16Q16 TaxID=1855659 RepID=UPI001116CFDE|nr:hypothetical protein [Mycobacterium sp. D16Q16]
MSSYDDIVEHAAFHAGRDAAAITVAQYPPTFATVTSAGGPATSPRGGEIQSDTPAAIAISAAAAHVIGLRVQAYRAAIIAHLPRSS